MKVTMMTHERLRDLLAAYGADPSRWPEAERAEGLRLLAADPGLAAEQAAAGRLDAALDRFALAPLPGGAAALSARVLPDFSPRPGWVARTRAALRALFDEVWPEAPLWKPAGAFAASLALGLVIAFASPVGDLAALGAGPDAEVVSSWLGEEDVFVLPDEG